MVLKHKKKGTAIHKIGGNYYLYKVKSVWDKNLKRTRKITEEYLGVITPEGLKPPSYKRNMPIHYIDSFLSEEFKGVRLNDKFLSEFLRILGSDRSAGKGE